MSDERQMTVRVRLNVQDQLSVRYNTLPWTSPWDQTMDPWITNLMLLPIEIIGRTVPFYFIVKLYWFRQKMSISRSLLTNELTVKLTFCLDFCLAAFFSSASKAFFSFSSLFLSFSSSFFLCFSSSFSFCKIWIDSLYLYIIAVSFSCIIMFIN